jgi:hypothetical protein
MSLKKDIIKLAQENYLSPKAILAILLLTYPAILVGNYLADNLNEMIVKSVED